MSPSKQKRKGTDWERTLVKVLEKLFPGSVWKRMAGSGAIGTIMGEPLLGGDISGTIPFLAKTIRGEAKTGYGGSKQMAIKREWLEKIAEEAERTYSIPILFAKFSGAHGRSKYMVIMDFPAFKQLIEELQELGRSEINLIEENELLKGNDK